MRSKNQLITIKPDHLSDMYINDSDYLITTLQKHNRDYKYNKVKTGNSPNDVNEDDDISDLDDTENSDENDEDDSDKDQTDQDDDEKENGAASGKKKKKDKDKCNEDRGPGWTIIVTLLLCGLCCFIVIYFGLYISFKIGFGL